MKSEEYEYPDHVLRQLIESVYRPAENWETCLQPMTTEQVVKKLDDHFPGKFDSTERVIELLGQLRVQHAYNEHNAKYYWLLNPLV